MKRKFQFVTGGNWKSSNCDMPACIQSFLEELNQTKPNKMLRLNVKVLANEDTLLRTHCCRHKCLPVCPRAQHLLRKQVLCPGHKNVCDFVQKHFVSATNVSQFARARTRHELQCFRNNVSSFVTALSRSEQQQQQKKTFQR